MADRNGAEVRRPDDRPVQLRVRNVAARKLTTALTAGGMALVVYVFATVLMLAAGLEQTLVATGQDDNVIVIRRGAQTEIQVGRRPAPGRHRRESARRCDWRGRRAASLEGTGRAHQSAEARNEQAIERRDPRRDARGARAASADKAGGGPDVPARDCRGDRRPRDRERLPGRRCGGDAALRVAGLGGGRRF